MVGMGPDSLSHRLNSYLNLPVTLGEMGAAGGMLKAIGHS